jgi:uncharacterized protein (DUF433 family)
VATPVRESAAPQNPVEVPIYTPSDVGRYLRVLFWLALALVERERLPPHPEFFYHYWWRKWPPLLLVDDSAAYPDLPETFGRVSFRRFADLYVRAFVVRAAAEWWRASPKGGGEWGAHRAFWRTIEDIAHAPDLFGEGGARGKGVTRLLKRLNLASDRIDPAYLKKCLGRVLARVEVKNGVPARLFPFTRDPVENSPRIVVMDPRIRFGRPTIAGRGTPTDVLFERHQAGDSIAELAEDHGIRTEEAEEAIRYEAGRPLETFPFFDA